MYSTALRQAQKLYFHPAEMQSLCFGRPWSSSLASLSWRWTLTRFRGGLPKPRHLALVR